MSDESLPPLPEDIRSLLSGEKVDVPAPKGARARVRERFRAELLKPTAPASTAEAPKLARGARRLSWLGPFVVGTVVGGVGVSLLRPDPPGVVAPLASPTVAAPTVASPTVASPTVASPTVVTSTAPAAPPPPSAAATSPKAPLPAQKAPPLPEAGDPREQALLEQARVALARGQPKQALIALESHAKGYPSSRLREEREALTVLALHASGDPSAPARAAEFMRRYPRSLFGPAIEAQLRRSSDPR